MKRNFVKTLFISCIAFWSYTGLAQEFNDFDIRYQTNIKGDLTFIANNILNRDAGNGNRPNDPYNATGGASQFNDNFNMQYIDIDGDPSTFSSSSATFTFPSADCNLIRYAGLYWSATYPSAQAGQAVGTGRENDFNQVRFRVPGGTYVDVVADEILYDGFTSAEAAMRQNSPYACYADVTSLITALPNPNGEYTIANVRSVTGALSPGGGASAGWTLVIIYENPTLSGKLITTFDGFARVRAANPVVDINYSGFNTIPVGPVRANIGVAALEGDNRIANVTTSIRAQSNPGFTTLSNATNPANNFFNSTISLDGVIAANRTPNSVNTLGYDTDIFLLNNPLNNVIPNNETAATFRFTSNQDQYYPFFNSFNVEIIEPEIVLEKKVEDIAGNDITGAGVNLGQQLDYVLTFQNTGNDNAVNYTIRDILPINVTFQPANLVLPPGVTYVYNAANNTITFTIPPNLVEVGDPPSSIRMRVRVAENCFDFIDACTDIIQNQAFSTYEGAINNNQISDDPSVSDFDNCGFVTPGATNFLLDDLSDCDFSRTVQLCGANVLLDAGDNFDDYIWYRDNNNNGIIDAADTVITDGNPDNDLSTLLVTQTGTYIVDKIIADPCKGFQEIITVIPFGNTQTNPIIDLINDPTNTVEGEVVACSIDGDLLPKIFLCGLNDTELIQINIPDAVSIVWQRLDETSCASSGDDCANKNGTCTWDQVSTGNSFLASDAGQYRLIINYQNGCFTRFYFNVFKNPLNPQFNKTDIICATPGNITVTNMPATYEYQLLNAVNGAVLVPYSANNGPSFTIPNNGAYTIEMRQQGVVGGCIFRLEDIGVLNRDFQVDITSRDTDCSGLGEIAISVLNVEPQYFYQISQGGVTIDTQGPSLDNNFTFQNLNPGVYDVLATTDDGCSYTEQITILDTSNLQLNARISQHISCREGNILMESTGGRTPHTYAIWSFVNTLGTTVTSYPDPSSIPASEFQTSTIFDILDPGDYTFVVVDRNNCFAISNTVTIELVPSIEFDPTTVINESCFGAANGSISFNLTNTNGYQLTFFLLDAVGNEITSNASGVFTGLPQGNYTVRLNQRRGGSSCDFFENYTISGPSNALTSNAVLVQEYTCTQFGSIEAQGTTGGTAPYTYSINGVTFGAPGVSTFTNLTAGTYTVTVRDANGCTFATNPITIAPLNPPTDLTFTATTPSCPSNISDVTATVVNGNAPFSFEILAPSAIAATSISGTTANFNGLAPNTYTFRVTDAKNCTYEETFTIAPVTPIDVVGQLLSNVSCFGSADGEALFTISGFGTGSYNYTVTGPANFTGSNQTAATIPLSGLAAGNYEITVTDTFTSCSAIATVTISAPSAALTLGTTATQPTCTANGNIQLTAANGWGSYSYTVMYPDGATTFTNTTGFFGGLTAAGNYLVSVEDANGCQVDSSITINAAIAPVLELVPNALCYTAAVGLTLTANITSGGDGNYQFSLNGGAFTATNNFSGLAPGTHTVIVRDGNNCTDTETITIRPELTVTASAAPITACATATNVTITAAGGDTNYVYAIVASGTVPVVGDFSATNPISVTGAGTYDVFVRDNNGNSGFCEAQQSLTITQNAPLDLTPTATPAVCFGEANGSIAITATGGAAPYQYSVDDGTTYQLSSNFNNLAAGTYNIRIRDANNCEETANIVVTQPDQLQAEAALTANYSCLQLGEITVGSLTPTSGGSGTYQYSLNGGVWTASTSGGTVFSGLTDGTYSVRVRDANAINCVFALPAITINPLPVAPVLATTVDYACDGSGIITVLPNDPSFTYSLDGGAPQASNVFSNLAPGNHTLTVDYGSDCTVTTSIIVESGRAFEATLLNFTNNSCNGTTDGTLSFEVENFNPINGFEYNINGGAFSAPQTVSPITIPNLGAGTYTIIVRDVLDPSCTITLTQDITQPDPVVANAIVATPFTCANLGATITASATGGTPAYQYQLEDTLGGIITPYQATSTFTNVPAGDYIVRIRDVNGCEDSIDVPLTIVSPSNPTFTTTPTACYSGNNDGSILVDVTSIPGNGGFLFSINGGPWLAPVPAAATSYTFGNLTAGTYSINVRDQFGCAATPQNVTINPQLTANALLNNDLTCLADAQVAINANGGNGALSYEWSSDGGTTYSNTNFAGNIFTTNADGTYIFRVTDAIGCTVETNAVTINPAVLPVINSILPTNLLCNGDNSGALAITFDASIGLAPFVINVLNTTTGVNYGTQTSGLAAGDYTVTVTDAKGCVTTDFATITEPNVINYSVTTVPITCDDVLNVTNPGSITITGISGGTAEYNYYLNANIPGFVTQTYTTTPLNRDHTFTVLEFGIYQVDVTDANGCSAFSTEIIASPPNDLDIDVTTLTADCTTGGTAIVTVGAAVGSGNYEFAILETFVAPYSSTYIPPDTPGGDTATFTGLIPGITYTFVVHDLTTDCFYFEEADAPINSPSNMTATLDTVANVSCTGAADGNISFTFDNYDSGATAVNYEIFNSQSNVSTGFSGTTSVNPPTGALSVTNFATLPPGEYFLLLSEVGGAFNGCSVFGGEFTIRQSVNPLALNLSVTRNDNCNVNAGVITASGQFGTGPYEYQILPVGSPAPTVATWAGSSLNVFNVEGGAYDVYIKDAFNCIQMQNILMPTDPAPEIALSLVDECAPEGSYEILVDLTQAGIPPYAISVNGSAFQNVTFNASNQYTVSGLSSGLGQTVTIQDLNGCGETQSFDIHPKPEAAVSVTKLLDCTVTPNGEITISASNGSGSFDYEISGPVNQARTAIPSPANSVVWNLASAAGDYLVSVYDNNTPSCAPLTFTVRIPPAVTPVFTETHLDVSCFGANDGSITLFQTDNGINPLAYSISPLAGTFNAATSSFENLPAGTYTITATGTNDCTTAITNIVIGTPAAIANVNATVVEFGCSAGNNTNNASITIDGSAITGGNGTYVIYEFINNGTASIVQTGSNPTYIETNIVGGTYTINVYDSNGCVGTTIATIAPFDALSGATAAITNPLSCTPGGDGEITITVTSTNSDPTRFEYSIDNGATYQASNVFSGLSAGTYTFLVRHIDTGCVVTTSETILPTDNLTLDVVSTTNVTCFGDANGEVELDLHLLGVTYGNTITYVLNYDVNNTPLDPSDDDIITGSSPNGNFLVSNLEAGSYSIVVTQSNFPTCSYSETFIIAGPSDPITAVVVVTDITCNPTNNGIIQITDVQGGWGSYTYYVGTVAPSGTGDFVASPRFENLAAGTYEAWVRDVNGCEQLIQNNIVLLDPTPVAATLQVNQENCTNLAGELEVIGTTGGQGSNYTYQLIKDGVAFGAPQSGRVFTGLGAGTYEVAISDQWGCTFTTPAELLYEEMNLTATVVKPLDCTPTPDGEITITVAGGSANLDFTVTFPDGTTTLNNATGIFTGLAQVGTYTFVVSDLDTTNPVCEKTIAATLDAPSVTTLAAATISNVSCNGLSDGSIRINIAPTTPGTNEDPIYVYNLYDDLGNLINAVPQTDPLFTGLAAGDYEVEAISGRGCASVRQNLTISEPFALAAAVSATAFSCNPSNGANTATVTAIVTPGTGTAPYVYSIDNMNFQTGNTFEIIDNTLAQNITVFVRDANGCATTDTVSIAPLNRFTATVSQDLAISCTGPEAITITANDDGNTANVYTYELLPVGNPNALLTGNPTYNTATFELTTVGSYTFRVTDTTTGCYFDTAPYPIAPFDLVEVIASATTPVTCFGDANGALEITVTGVVNGAYDYVVFNADGTPTAITGTGNTSSNPLAISGLSGGSYFVRVSETGLPNCSEDSNVVSIVSPDIPLTAVVSPLASVTCDNNLGEILVDPSGGFAPYAIVLTNTTTSQNYTANNVQSFVFTGLAAGNFTVAITDANGCVLNDTETLVPAVPITADITATPTTLACFGDTNASVRAINVVGGQGVYQYALNYYDASGTAIEFSSGSQTSQVFTNLGAGIYSITVSDGWNCDVETTQVTINEPSEVATFLIQVAPLSCTTDAQIRLTANGGTAPYQFSIDGITFTPMSGGNVHTFTVGAGNYQYYVRDALGCTSLLSNQVSIEPVPPLTLAIDASAAIINCNGESTASIRATATGGLGNYQYELYTDAALTNRIAGPQATRDFANLGAGNYYIRVSSGDCETVSTVITITEPAPLVVTDSFTNVSCAGATDGTITVSLSGGSGDYIYAISPNLNQFDTVNTFTELAGSPTGITYTVVAQDVNGCFEVLEYTIFAPEPVTVTATALPEICAGSNDGSISLVINGGTAPFSTSLNSNNTADFIADQTLFTDLAAGTYVVFVRDAQGCETNAVVEIDAGVNLNATVTPVYECTGNIPTARLNVVLEDTDIVSEVMYAIDSTDPLDMVLEPNFTNIPAGDHFLAITHTNGCINTIPFTIVAYEPLTLILEQRGINEITAVAAGGLQEYTFLFGDVNNGTDNTFFINRTDTYTVTVIDENGCEVSAQIFMEFIDIEIPNFFTPDGDGNNDFWKPRNQEGFPQILTIIYDRYGRVVYRMGLNDQGWDGTYNGKELPSGDYWHIIKLNGENDHREFVGHFTLYR
ncbi:T9SS type B sorting domain-containing protein [Arenibacter sp. GZD96]|uniref:T9SS type B sorting domain-containing protein n=1 Tax=Aurantibrevibacter litoralis TaxID=3106030 RepID=UPI002AFE8C37|nr:T9SS type B sorting domain-containing protein [Arenibacter sp. GZD-96]MEA1786476.1 T9SS type B sorting domain-containing protein [Arenibacter sp. GZD-96]